MSERVEIICERLGLESGPKPITEVIFDPEGPKILVEVAGSEVLRLSVADARKLGDALTVATSRSFLRKQKFQCRFSA